MKIDLNSDLGESFGSYKIGCDREVIPLITTANVGCGFHGGDPMVMAETVKLCKENNVRVGAHPGYPDLQGFGRRKMVLTYEEIKNNTIYQIGALMAFCDSYEIKMQHVKPHGAFGNLAMVDEDTANAFCEAAASVDKNLMVYGYAGCTLLKVAEKHGLRPVHEFYCDRAYMEDGTLAPRKLPGAVIHDKDFALSRALRMVETGEVETLSGKTIKLNAESFCVHGDTPEALSFITEIRRKFTEAGIEITNVQ